MMWSRQGLIVSAACAIALSACKKEEVEEPVVPVEPTPPIVEEPVVPPVVEEPVVEEPVAVVDETMFINAAYEATCVQSHVADAEKQKAILNEVYARYGFDETNFKTAQDAVGEKLNVQTAVKTRMEKCTPEMAMKFETAGAAALEGEAEAVPAAAVKKAPSKPKMAYKPGRFMATGLSSSGIDGGEVILMLRDNKKVTGMFKGKREGKAFTIPVSGTVSDDGSFSAQGSQGQNKAAISGKASGSSARGIATGTVNSKGYKVSFSAS